MVPYKTDKALISEPDFLSFPSSDNITATSLVPTTYDSQTGRASTVQVSVAMSVTLTDRSGKVLYQNPSYLFRDNYQVSQQLNSFFQEDTPALQRLSRDFARTLVSDILEGY